MSLNYNLPFGRNVFKIVNDATTYQPTTQWDLIPTFVCSTDIHRSRFTQKLSAVKREKHWIFECISLHETLAEYSIVKAWEGDTVTLTPHTDELGITYECVIKRVECIYTTARRWAVRLVLIQSSSLILPAE